MQTHAETKHLPYTQEQMFKLVSDIAKYPEFLPWCISTRILSREGNELQADMVIGYKVFREGFTSRVILTEPERIDVTFSRGPFKFLNNHWIFHYYGKRRCKLVFFINIGMHKGLLGDMFSNVFFLAAEKLTLAFEKRARYLYSNS